MAETGPRIEPRVAWQREYAQRGLPTSRRLTPSRAARDLLSYLKAEGRTSGDLLDLGCGSGRNAALFAAHGYSVCGLDFVEEAGAEFRDLADSTGLRQRMSFKTHDLRLRLPFPPGSFDVVYAITTLENLTNDDELAALYTEVVTVLKTRGLFAVYYLTDKDGFYGPRILQSELPRKVVWAEDAQMTQRVFSRFEMTSLFCPGFKVAFFAEYSFDDERYGSLYTRNLEMIIFRKRVRRETAIASTLTRIP